MPAPAFVASPPPRPRMAPRRIATRRERQWQHAAFIASIATLAAMLGYAIAANVAPSAPLPQSLMQNPVQQQVPFGPAKINMMPAAKPAAQASSSPAVKTAPKPEQKKAAAKRRPARRIADDEIAEDEVVVRHAPTSKAQRAQSTARIRRYSDEN